MPTKMILIHKGTSSSTYYVLYDSNKNFSEFEFELYSI
jgi:hypothetical protein